MNTLVQEIIKALADLSDPQRIEFNAMMIPTRQKIVGVTTPDLQLVLKELRLATLHYSIREKLDLAIALVETDIFECAQLAFEFVGKDKTLIKSLTKTDLQLMNRNLDNWASVDCFGVYVHGKAWRMEILINDDIIALAKHENLWQRRLAIVSTIPLNQKSNGGTGDVERTLLICDLLIDDRNDLIIKALSWALRELAKREQSPVEAYLLLNKHRLHNRVLREVSNKITFGKKNPV